jgi:hypothetical protein
MFAVVASNAEATTQTNGLIEFNTNVFSLPLTTYLFVIKKSKHEILEI